MIRALVRRVRSERGYTLVEMLTVMVIMGIVMGSLTTVFVSATNSESDMNRRFQAQLTARLALDKMRREVHCASVVSSATPAVTSASSITITLPSYCVTGSGSITWCTRSVSTNRYALYRVSGTTCSGGVKWADYLAPSATAPVCSGALCIFKYAAQSSSSLAKLTVDFPVNIRPSKTVDMYELQDDIVLRNSSRS